MKPQVVRKMDIDRSNSSERPELDWLSLGLYEGWNFNSGNYLFTTDTK